MSLFAILLICLGVLVAFAIIFLTIFIRKATKKKPTGQGNWSLDQAILPWAEIQGENITLHNIRNFTYRTMTDYTPQYYDKTFKLTDIVSVDFVLEPILKVIGIAHTLLTFGLADGSHIAISIEIRKHVGERYSALKGLFNHFELMYVIADERDVIGLRANIRKDDVYVYPLEVSREESRKLFMEMIQRANILKEKPEFYNTLTNACATNLIGHINSATSHHIPWSIKIVVPEHLDKLAYAHGLIDNSLPFKEIKKKYRINARAAAAKDDPLFSAKIRQI